MKLMKEDDKNMIIDKDKYIDKNSSNHELYILIISINNKIWNKD